MEPKCECCKKVLSDWEQSMMFLIRAQSNEVPWDSVVDDSLEVCERCFDAHQLSLSKISLPADIANDDDSSNEEGNNTLTIKDVHLELLDHQRQVLGESLHRIGKPTMDLHLSPTEVGALQGVVNMLDEWSDEYYAKNLPKMKYHALPELRDTICLHECAASNGHLPCVGPLQCLMCGTTFTSEEELIKSRRQALKHR